jgi:hypothetical protein
MPIEPSARPGEPGIAGAFDDFSTKPVTRSVSSTDRTPNRCASWIGISMAASVTAAPRSLWKRSIFA